MSVEHSELEQVWLQAETAAEEAKHAALRASDELERRRGGKARKSGDITLLLTTVEQAKAKQDEAERMASAAFDRLWQAKEQPNGRVNGRSNGHANGHASAHAAQRGDGTHA